MENLPKVKRRGRPRKLPEPTRGGLPPGFPPGFPQMPEGMREAMGLSAPTARTEANRFYADKARPLLPKLSKSLRDPYDPARVARVRVGIDWILGRATVLSELGRMMGEEPSQEGFERLRDVVRYIAERRPNITAREAVAYVRRARLGETGRSGRLRALHHDLNAAVTYHRRRFPESSWADVLEALELTKDQVRKKVR